MSDACLGLSALPLQQNLCPPRDRAGAARPKGSCIWGARVCMPCEELRMDMGVNLCVSALKFNINFSDENQSCWILLNFLLRKKNSSPFLLQLENPMQSHYNMRRKNPQAPANFRCEINCKKKKRELKQRNRSLRFHFLASELKKIHCWSVVSLGLPGQWLVMETVQ